MKCLRLLAAGLLVVWAGSGCSSNLSRFDLINLSGTPQANQITRAETGDQGSGNAASASGPGGHSLTRVTVGGSYLRRTDAQAPAASKASAGLFGNMRATR